MRREGEFCFFHRPPKTQSPLRSLNFDSIPLSLHYTHTPIESCHTHLCLVHSTLLASHHTHRAHYLPSVVATEHRPSPLVRIHPRTQSYTYTTLVHRSVSVDTQPSLSCTVRTSPRAQVPTTKVEHWYTNHHDKYINVPRSTFVQGKHNSTPCDVGTPPRAAIPTHPRHESYLAVRPSAVGIACCTRSTSLPSPQSRSKRSSG